MTGVFAALAGAAVMAGLVVAVIGARSVPVPEAGASTTAAPSHWRSAVARWAGTGTTTTSSTWTLWRWPTALAAGMLAWLLTGWPVAGAIGACAVVWLPILLSTSAVAKRGIDRVEAVEEWTRRLSDVLVVGVGLDQAIASTVRTCPAPIQREVSALSARLAARWPTEQAVRAFADDLDDASADLVAATLILGARRRGPGLARVLAAVSDSVAEDVAMRRRVEAERAKPRTTARAVTLITLSVVAVGAWNGTYLRPYATPLGQLVLLAITGGFIGSLAWMRALTLTEPAPRILRPEPRGGRS